MAVSGLSGTGGAETRDHALRVIEIVVADPGERQIGERHVVFSQLVESNRIGRGTNRASFVSTTPLDVPVVPDV